MDNNQLKNYVIVALVTALIVLSVVWVRDSFSGGAENVNAAGINAAGSAVGGNAAVATGVSTEGSYFKGEEDAQVTIIEFSDFQCPFCGRFFSDALPQIERNYVATGKVKFVYKDFPLDSIHPQATPAALAARCAGDQEKFWEFHDKIFANQQSLGSAAYGLWAGQLGLDAEEFDGCMASQKHLSAVRADFAEGQRVGVSGTPAFLINGQLISGAQPYAVFQQAIEAALSG